MRNFTIKIFVGELISERENWENDAYRKSNDQLYALLAKCLVLYEDYAADKTKKAWKDEFLKVATCYGITKLKGNLVRPIVRVVFGDSDMCRKRVSTYGKVLEAALTSNITSDKLPEWIKSQGGVQEISRPVKAGKVSAEDKQTLVKSTLKTRVQLDNKQLRDLFDIAEVGELRLMLVEREDSGAVSVKALVNSETVIKSALTSLYTVAANAQEKKAVEKRTKSASHQMLNAAKKAA
jgi:hypothetical protein